MTLNNRTKFNISLESFTVNFTGIFYLESGRTVRLFKGKQRFSSKIDFLKKVN